MEKRGFESPMYPPTWDQDNGVEARSIHTNSRVDDLRDDQYDEEEQQEEEMELLRAEEEISPTLAGEPKFTKKGGEPYKRVPKEKSLTQLAEAFLRSYGSGSEPSFHLDRAAQRLGADRKRLAIVVAILESLGILHCSAKHCYEWTGFAHLPNLLIRLKQACTQGREQLDAVAVVNASESADSEQLRTNEMTRRLAALCQVADVVALDDVAADIGGEAADAVVQRGIMKRLWDIATILCVLGLMQKVNKPGVRKPSYQWVGEPWEAATRAMTRIGALEHLPHQHKPKREVVETPTTRPAEPSPLQLHLPISSEGTAMWAPPIKAIDASSARSPAVAPPLFSEKRGSSPSGAERLQGGEDEATPSVSEKGGSAATAGEEGGKGDASATPGAAEDEKGENAENDKAPGGASERKRMGSKSQQQKHRKREERRDADTGNASVVLGRQPRLGRGTNPRRFGPGGLPGQVISDFLGSSRVSSGGISKVAKKEMFASSDTAPPPPHAIKKRGGAAAASSAAVGARGGAAADGYSCYRFIKCLAS